MRKIKQIVRDEDDGKFDGYRTSELRDLAMLNAALSKDPSMFGEMNEKQKAEYDELVEWLKTLPEGATVDVGYNMD